MAEPIPPDLTILDRVALPGPAPAYPAGRSQATTAGAMGMHGQHRTLAIRMQP